MITGKYTMVGDEELELLRETLSSHEFSGNSDVVALYQADLAEYFGTAFALASSSGTAAIHLALLAGGVRAGDDVVVPATAAVMTALPVLAIGAEVRFIDVAPTSFAISADLLDSTITERTRAVITVPMWGYEDNAAELLAVCADREILLIEDAAQAHGSQTAKGYIGALGHIGAFSTHGRKLVSTGEGGFCLTNDSTLFDRLYRLRTLGQDPAGDPASFGREFGLNFKLSGLCAAVGRAQLHRLAARVFERNSIADKWRTVLSEVLACEWVAPPAIHNCYGLALSVDPSSRQAVEQALLEAGILTDTSAYGYRVLYEHDLFSRYRPEKRCKNAELFVNSLIVLPCHEGIDESTIYTAGDKIAECITSKN